MLKNGYTPYYMTFNLYNYGDEKNVIKKALPSPTVLDGVLRDGSSITDPIITISYGNPREFNYTYIPDFGRYYFINDMVSINNGIWDITMHVDVLKSFQSEILDCEAVLYATEDEGATQYMEGEMYKSLVKDKTDIINFGSGFLENGEYILITAGG